jgi:hypothetical protein
VFFLDAVEHIARIVRVLRQPRGNAMLVGVGGSGKQSLTRFATFIGGFKIFSVELTRGYGSNEFREDIKKLYRTAGIAGEPVVFLFSDTQVRTMWLLVCKVTDRQQTTELVFACGPVMPRHTSNSWILLLKSSLDLASVFASGKSYHNYIGFT